MPSQYPILDNKPIDQWRVADLREELRRRKLVTKGLKEELVKRLDEALREDGESENITDGDESNSDSQSNINEEVPSPGGADDKQTMFEEDINTNEDATLVKISSPGVNQGPKAQNGDSVEVSSVGKDDKVASTVDLEGNASDNQSFNALSGMQGELAESQKFRESCSPLVGIDEKISTSDLGGVANNYPVVVMDEKISANDLQGVAQANQNISAQYHIEGEDAESVEMFGELKSSIVRIDEKEATSGDLDGSASFNENITVKFSMQKEDVEPNEEFEESEPLLVETTDIQLEQSNQVSEVNQDFEFPVKYKSISTDSVSINEKNNIKDNLIADHFPLELVVKQELVQSSSSSYPTGGGSSYLIVDEQEAAMDHATDVQEGLKDQVLGLEVVQDKQEKNISYAANDLVVQTHVSCEQGRNEERSSLDDADMQNISTLDLPKKEDCVEASSPEKLNLDRSSGDESMEEDILDTKHMEADTKFAEPDSTIEAKMLDAKLEESAIDDVNKCSSKMNDIAVEDEKPASLTEKRKLEEAEVVVNNGPPKRHRRWNPDTIKVPEQQISHPTISTTPKNNLQPVLRRTFSTSNSTISAESPKERIVPTSKKPATTSLRIDNFLRPFTLKAVQELLAKTGQVCEFWMDHIKTHCFVTYSSAEEALETRNAVYNLQWPPNGGRFLIADFVDPQEVKLRSEAPPPSPAPISSVPSTPKAPSSQQTQAPKPAHQQNLRLQPLLPPPPPLLTPPPPPPPPPLLASNPPIARERLPPPPPKKPEPPVMTLDDLFKKTRATPRIYYLPLTEEQVSAKLAAQSKRTQA